MKNRFLKKLALGMTVVMVAGSLSACGSSDSATNGGGTSEAASSEATENTTPADASSEAASSEAASDDAQTEAGSNDTLVVGYDTFGSKFSPFFANLAYDQDVASMVSLGLLGTDREGNVIYKGIEGETRPYNGKDYTYNGIADLEVSEGENGQMIYDFTLRDDIKFSDGVPMTIDDVIFSMYVYADPTFDGGSTFYTLPIVGMEEYRSGMGVKSDLMFAAGQDNTDFSFWTQEEQDAYWANINEGGAVFAGSIADYVNANYAGSYADVLAACGNSPVAFGMNMWGFGEPNEDGTKIVGAGTGTEYDTATVTNADYWTEIAAAYENDYAAISDTEAADLTLPAAMGVAFPEYATGLATGDSAPNIAGIEKTGDYSMRITMESFDAVAIYQLGVTVAPLHYYGSTDLYDYDNNMFGFNKGDMSLMKAVTTKPLGAGPYKFESYENGVVTFSANENYFQGCPKIKTILFQETSESDKLSGVVAGTFDISNPSMSLPILNAIKEDNPNGEITGEVLTTVLTDNLGYGYIALNANEMLVGTDKASEESKALRKGFATLFAAYRDTVINSYYAEMANVIQYPISNTSWAAPRPADEGYRIAYSVDADGNDIYTSDMTDEQKYEAALDAAVSFFKKAGYTYDEAAGTFTAAPEGAEMSYEVIIPGGGVADHPAYGILTAAKEALASIGLTLEINDPSDNSVWNNALDSGTFEMIAGAWGATVDPDMYQVYHSDNANGNGTTSNHYAIEDDTLDQLIMDARVSPDQSYRKATYKECLDIILDWGVEIPTYQRQNAFLFSTERVNMDTVTPDITTFWSWMNDLEKLEMN